MATRTHTRKLTLASLLSSKDLNKTAEIINILADAEEHQNKMDLRWAQDCEDYSRSPALISELIEDYQIHKREFRKLDRLILQRKYGVSFEEMENQRQSICPWMTFKDMKETLILQAYINFSSMLKSE